MKRIFFGFACFVVAPLMFGCVSFKPNIVKPKDISGNPAMHNMVILFNRSSVELAGDPNTNAKMEQVAEDIYNDLLDKLKKSGFQILGTRKKNQYDAELKVKIHLSYHKDGPQANTNYDFATMTLEHEGEVVVELKNKGPITVGVSTAFGPTYPEYSGFNNEGYWSIYLQEVAPLLVMSLTESKEVEAFADSVPELRAARAASAAPSLATNNTTASSPVKKVSLVFMPFQEGGGIASDQKASFEAALLESLSKRYTVYSGKKVQAKVEEVYKKRSKEAGAGKECDDTKCVQDIAMAFDSELVATAKVAKTPSGYLISLKIQNVIEENTVFSKAVPCKECDEFAVVRQLQYLAQGSN